MKGIINDLYSLKSKKTTIISGDKLTGYSIYVYHFFVFLYDLGDFDSFETMKKYFEKIKEKFDITDLEDNCITCIIGNKKDKKVNFFTNYFSQFYQNIMINFFLSKISEQILKQYL